MRTEAMSTMSRFCRIFTATPASHSHPGPRQSPASSAHRHPPGRRRRHRRRCCAHPVGGPNAGGNEHLGDTGWATAIIRTFAQCKNVQCRQRDRPCLDNLFHAAAHPSDGETVRVHGLCIFLERADFQLTERFEFVDVRDLLAVLEESARPSAGNGNVAM